eukprot:3288506-Amphidinium_carterae.2
MNANQYQATLPLFCAPLKEVSKVSSRSAATLRECKDRVKDTVALPMISPPETRIEGTGTHQIQLRRK